MIKNILYSIFFHSILFLAVYTSFYIAPNPKPSNLDKHNVNISFLNIKEPQRPKEIETPEKKEEPEVELNPEKQNIKEKVKKPTTKEKKVIKEKPKKKIKKRKKAKKPKKKQKNIYREAVLVDKNEKKENELDNLNLSIREKINIKSQLQRCYNRAISQSKKEAKIKLTFKVSIDQFGYITSDISHKMDKTRYLDKEETEYKLAIDNAQKTLNLCSPLRNLPITKYHVWNKVVLEFGKDNAK